MESVRNHSDCSDHSIVQLVVGHGIWPVYLYFFSIGHGDARGKATGNAKPTLLTDGHVGRWKVTRGSWSPAMVFGHVGRWKATRGIV